MLFRMILCSLFVSTDLWPAFGQCLRSGFLQKEVSGMSVKVRYERVVPLFDGGNADRRVISISALNEDYCVVKAQLTAAIEHAFLHCRIRYQYDE